jgi:Rieske Fe-S protein
VIDPSGERGPDDGRAPEDDLDADAIDAERRRVATWLWRLPVLLVAGGGSWALYEAIRVHFFKRRPAATPDWRAGGPAPVAPLAFFERDWAAVEFMFENTPAIAVRLPGPIPGGLEVDGLHLAAFSRVCTHLGCTVSLNRDAEAIAFAFNYRAPGPQLVCRCHLSVFDPDRAGRAVAGPAIEPLPRLRLERDGDRIVATGTEPAPAFTGLGS